MSRIRQLAMNWHRQATEDLRESQTGPLELRPEFALIAKTRRNCAWELMRTLSEMEKESPLEGGRLSSGTNRLITD